MPDDTLTCGVCGTAIASPFDPRATLDARTWCHVACGACMGVNMLGTTKTWERWYVVRSKPRIGEYIPGPGFHDYYDRLKRDARHAGGGRPSN